ncbi:MAG: prepilin-type N-terminal cleavage/methylation domain-containing protein [Candidatus Omnitrophica bacterium]|nr:prepilin-type N-terminal cleavage/methylation domain-containing protein [Candidatus Omnitrophota bacterium]
MFSQKKGFTLVEIMIVVAIIALLAAIAIPNLLRSRLNAAEANAQATLKTMSTAMESYAAANEGTYPTGISQLTSADPAYLNKDYTASTIQGYDFACSFTDAEPYSCTATPAGAFSGKGKTYTVTTGGIMTSTSPGTTTDTTTDTTSG